MIGRPVRVYESELPLRQIIALHIEDIPATAQFIDRGLIVDLVPVHLFMNEQADILCISDPSIYPDASVQAEMAERGFWMTTKFGNPKIRLADGSIIYGCECWWVYESIFTAN